MSGFPVTHASPPALPGYRFLQRLGSGGSAEVFLYEQAMPERKVAVKVLHQSGLTESIRDQFTAEANAMARLADHPHIVQVLHADVAGDGRPYLVMQYYGQPNLSVRARREHFSVPDVLRIGIQIGSAVETSHRNRILHRDIKPHNILTGQFGEPALSDFGIAARKGADGPDGVSIPWSAPEVLYRISDGDERSDVYSLAATLWHLLTGHSPFEATAPGGDNGPLALMSRVRSDPLPRTQRSDVPESLERLLRQAMAKDPAARPQSALEFVRALQAVEQELRLPLTRIVLAADSPPSEPLPSEPLPSEPLPSEPLPSEPLPSGPLPSGPISSGPLPGAAFFPRPAGDDGDPTRVRARRIDPLVPPPAVGRPPRSSGTSIVPDYPPSQVTRTRGVRAAHPEPGPPAATEGRHRQIPVEAAEEPTQLRPRAASPARTVAAHDETGSVRGRARGHSARVIGTVAAGILTIAVIGIAVALPHHSHGPGTGAAAKSGNANQSGLGQSALGPGITAPGTPAVSVTRVSASELQFSWTYDNHAKGDLFLWHRVSGGSGETSGSTTKPVLLIAAASNQTVCITVQVVRADGGQESTSSLKCGS